MTNVEQVFDWYLGLARLLPQSSEPLLTEEELRTKLGVMGLGSASMAHYAGLTPRTGPDAGESDV